MKTIAYIAASLDGYIADKDSGVDWLNSFPNPEQSDYGFEAFMQGIDALLMGANTFKVVQSFSVWPYRVPVYVASSSIPHTPPGFEQRIELLQGSILDILGEISARGVRRLYVDGGKIIQSCLKAESLDEMIITHIPVLLGSGIPLFPHQSECIQLNHVNTEVLGIGLVKSHYLLNYSPDR